MASCPPYKYKKKAFQPTKAAKRLSIQKVFIIFILNFIIHPKNNSLYD